MAPFRQTSRVLQGKELIIDYLEQYSDLSSMQSELDITFRIMKRLHWDMKLAVSRATKMRPLKRCVPIECLARVFGALSGLPFTDIRIQACS